MRLEKYLILCECRDFVKPDRVLLEVLEVFPIGGGEPWPVITVGETAPANSQDLNHNSSGQTGSTGSMENKCHRYMGKDATDPTEAILRSLSGLLYETAKSSIDS